MAATDAVCYRLADAGDAPAIAALHADSLAAPLSRGICRFVSGRRCRRRPTRGLERETESARRSHLHLGCRRHRTLGGFHPHRARR
jgi:hypothetical protein